MTKLSPRSQGSHQTVTKETTFEDPSSGGDASRVPAFKKTAQVRKRQRKRQVRKRTCAGSASSEETLTSSNETLPTDVPEAVTPSAIVKRSRDDSADANGSVEDAAGGEPPAKTAMTRRLRYRPRPNISVEAERRAVDETPPHT
ncbi:hypothetical protein MTO96_012707 [Rhipicephalus appendiculatus]